MNKAVIKKYNDYLKQFKKNKYILEVFKAMTILYLSNNWSKVAMDYKKTYFKEFINDDVNNSLIIYLYSWYDYDIPNKDLKKATDVFKQYISNLKKYAA